ncbi:TRIC cation channel family protein [Arsenicicoccus cauae]|uniref:TRIC cation channel family protein n=1 Tax=Arsenicicoccus cauae TaxID=2663847 RepID=UPI00370D702C
MLVILSELGGGMIRDTLLQGGPPVALTDTWYLIVVGAPMVLIAKARGWTLPGESARVGVRAIKRRYPRQSS